MPQMSPLYWELLFAISLLAVTGVLVKSFYSILLEKQSIESPKISISRNPMSSYNWLW